MHQCPGYCVAIVCAVVNNARDTHGFSSGIKCLHCMYVLHFHPKYQYYEMFICSYVITVRNAPAKAVFL